MALDGSQYVELLRELSVINAHSHIETPSICVVGDQSAGKSSLIQRICGIPLPRSDGTCTRCPMEVMLIPASSWSCTVRIRTEWDHTSGNKVDKVNERAFGPDMTNVEDVELRIKQAQKAVLNPENPAESYLDYNFEKGAARDAAGNQLSFSKNLVVLEVRGAPYSLTLIDLPGIINATESEQDAHLITLIRDLVISYISEPRTIIVAAISCKNDIDNQVVFKLAREVPNGLQRTLGVLTKPDTIEDGCHEAWLDVMRGKKFPLVLGYFMVRNPTKVELDENVSSEEFQKTEMKFFKEHPHLKSLKEGILAQRLGVPSCAQELSGLLVRMVKEQLPGMKKSVEEQLKDTRTQLADLPPEVRSMDRASVLQQAMRHMGRDALSLVCAEGGRSKELTRGVKAAMAQLAGSVASTRPKFVLIFEDPSQDPSGQPQKVFASYGEGDSQGHDSGYEFSIADVKEIIANERSFELPDFMPYAALVTVIQNFQGAWDSHAYVYLDSCATLLKDELQKLASKHFARFSESQLESHIRSCVEELVEQKHAQARDCTDFITALEASIEWPFTLNEQFQDSFNKTLDGIKATLQKHKMTGVSQEEMQQNLGKALVYLARIPGLGMQGLTQEQLLGRLETSQEVEEEIKIIAATMAYFKMSSKRFVDYIALTPMLILNKQTAESVEDHLDRYFKRLATKAEMGGKANSEATGNEEATKPWQESEAVLSLMAEDHVTAQKRCQLGVKLDSLLRMKTVLSKFA